METSGCNDEMSSQIIVVEVTEPQNDSPPDTQPLPPQLTQYQVDSTPDDKAWGILINKDKNISLTLNKEQFKVGRERRTDHTDYVFPRETLYYEQISKIHFVISREQLDEAELTYITDSSVNGTYVNGVLIGRGNRQLLCHNSKISIILEHNIVFTFLDLVANCKKWAGIPDEITNNYILLRSLGKGGYGQVYLTIKKSTNELMALKIIENNEKYVMVDPFTEPQIMHTVNHENVVRIIDLMVLEKAFFLFLEFVPGGNLADYVLKRYYLQEKIAKHIFFQLMRGIAYLHFQKIVHRDIKPLNILVSDHSEYPALKITDFGLSRKLRQNVSQIHTRCGTRSFSPPEMMNPGNVHFDCRWDIWSAGVVLYFCISGQLPFRDADNVSVEVAICNRTLTFDPAERWKNFSRSVVPLVKKMLQKKWIERPFANVVLNDPWFIYDHELMKRFKNVANLKHKTENLPPRSEMGI